MTRYAPPANQYSSSQIAFALGPLMMQGNQSLPKPGPVANALEDGPSETVPETDPYTPALDVERIDTAVSAEMQIALGKHLDFETMAA